MTTAPVTTVPYARVYADSAGESHFEDANMELRAANFAPPAPSLLLSTLMPAAQWALAAAPAGWEGDWHPTPRRQFILRLSGEIEFGVSSGEVRRFGAGSFYLLEDTTGKGHTARVIGGDALGVVIQLPD